MPGALVANLWSATNHRRLETSDLMVTIDAKLTSITESALDRFVRRARRAAGVRGNVHVLVVSNRRMQALNRQFRGKNTPTDVLSFPAMAEVAQEFAGDIVISADIAAASARALRHPLVQELKVLILHGVLHLAGHDHERDNGEMARKESRLRNQFRLSDGLIERAHRANKSTSKRTSPPQSSRSGRGRR